MTLNDHGLRGARIVYQRFAFHLSLRLRAAALAFAPFAMRNTSYRGLPRVRARATCLQYLNESPQLPSIAKGAAWSSRAGCSCHNQ